MADIRSFRQKTEDGEERPVPKYKEERPQKASAKPRDFRRQIRLHRFTILYRTALTLGLIAAIAAVVWQQYESKIYVGYRVLESSPKDEISGTTSRNLGGNILVFSKDGAHCLDEKGGKLWDQTFEMQNPHADVCRSTAAIGDYNGRTIYIVSASSILGEIHTNLPIKDFCVAANGIVATILEDGNISWIYVYDVDGTELVGFKTTMVNSGYPLAIGISPSAELFAVSYLYVDRGSMKTSVSFYNFGAVGQNYTDRYVSGYDYADSIVPEIRFASEDTAYAISDSKLMFYGGKQIPVSQAEVFLKTEARSVFYSDGYVIPVYNDTTGEHKYQLEVYDMTGDCKLSCGFDLEYTDIVTDRKNIVIYNETECMIVNQDGVEKYSGSFNAPVALVIPKQSGYRYVLVTSKSVETVQLE